MVRYLLLLLIVIQSGLSATNTVVNVGTSAAGNVAAFSGTDSASVSPSTSLTITSTNAALTGNLTANGANFTNALTFGGASVATVTGIASAFVTLTDGATITLTCDASKSEQNAIVTLGGNRTLAISGVVNGMKGVLKVIQGAGSNSLTLPASSKVINGGSGAITLTTTASAIDVLCWYYDGTSYLWSYGKNFN